MSKTPGKPAARAAKAPARPKAARSRAVAPAGPVAQAPGEGSTPIKPWKGSADGKHLVIVESPTKAKTINKYLGDGYLVMASVGHVRDLPSRAPKGIKQEVPGVDIGHDFKPTYEILPDKKKTIGDLRRAARQASDVWFATDLDREGEAIAWHLAQALGVPEEQAKRVVFNAITKKEIQNAFAHPRGIDGPKVNAQQARRILDRIVGYQVSPLLWKKVAANLSAGRVQSVAVRVVVEREREIDAFVPEEFWKISGVFATAVAQAADQSVQWAQFLKDVAPGKERTVREQLQWLGEHNCLRGELVELAGKPFETSDGAQALDAARRLGLVILREERTEEPKAKGPAKNRLVVVGKVTPQEQGGPRFAIRNIETKRTTARPGAPFITSTLQQIAANRLGFPLKRTMRVAQQLYEGVDIGGAEGQVGLITYMRTDSTHLSAEALEMARSYIGSAWGRQYLPDKPNFYVSSNKSAQEAHEAIRPTDANLTPKRVKGKLSDEQYKLYRLIWERFLASQMVPAQWDATSVFIEAAKAQAVFKSTGRRLVFDGFYKAAGVPSGDEPILPELTAGQQVAPLTIDPTQHFTSPPPRYTEASLQKKLEEEGIGRPSTYAPIIQTIQDRQYVQSVAPGDRRLMATDLGKVVTDMLVNAFPQVMDVAYTRKMESELDLIETDQHDWVEMLREFYTPFRRNLEAAQQNLMHAKAVTEPAPHKCPECKAGTVYRFGRKGRFLSCSRYPDCKYAAPVDKEGNPTPPEVSDILCPKCSKAMSRRVGRFGAFLGCVGYPQCDGIVKLDKKGAVVLPKPPPLKTELPCPKCASPLSLRSGKRGPWLSCSNFPKCRGRLAWSTLEKPKQAQLVAQLEAHEQANPQPVIRNTQGQIVPEGYIPLIAGAPAAGESADAAVDSDAA